MKITFVKKINSDGNFCSKCNDVQKKLEQSGHIEHIDEVVIADTNIPSSQGMVLASLYNVSQAPFFVVEREGEAPQIYTIYFKFVKEVLNQKSGANSQLTDLMNGNTDMDFI